MIKSFKNKETKAFYGGKVVGKWQSLVKQIEKKLHILDMAICLNDLKNLPSNRFKALIGRRKGQFSIRINKQWRICFKWIDGEPHEVEITDYH